jgi:hypothetical protein
MVTRTFDLKNRLLPANQSLPEGVHKTHKSQRDSRFRHELTESVNSAESELTAEAEVQTRYAQENEFIIANTPQMEIAFRIVRKESS